MSADNFVGVWFDGEMWRVESGLSASSGYLTRTLLESMFANSRRFQSRAEALCLAHDRARENGCEYGVYELQEEAPWDDREDQWSKAINEAHPTRSGSHETWAIAMKMVGNRNSKMALVALVNWLLVKAKTR